MVFEPEQTIFSFIFANASILMYSNSDLITKKINGE